MKELVGRLTALDPAASETLKIIEYFDTLVAGHAGTPALARAAAALSGVRVGVEISGRSLCVEPDGSSQTCSGVPAGALRREMPNGMVWLERAGTPAANDAMVLERFALAVGAVAGRGGARGSIEVVVDPSQDVGERRAAGVRLRLPSLVRVVITRVGEVAPAGATTEMMTEHGTAQVTLADATTPIVAGGVGRATHPDDVATTFLDALTAARLTDADCPRVDVADLGVLVSLVRGYRASGDDDVARLASLDDRALRIADALNESESLRAASTRLGMHHSTLQARHASLMTVLGYDPLRPDGRTRYRVSRLLLRLQNSAPLGTE